MQRDHLKFLKDWRNDPIRVPLLIRGARQVGKSWLVSLFGKEFSSYIEVNFEKDKRVHALFPSHISLEKTLEQLQVYTQKKIIPGKTLLFLDEIQECPDAIRYLRYFKEELPELHVIAAGSLLEFTLEKLGMAVGRVDYLFLYPLSFMEFLTANQRDDLRQNIERENIDPATHAVILDYLRNYMWLGGMPAVVDIWLSHKDSSLCQRVQDRIIKTYIDDFQKYAKSHQVEHIGHVFSSIPKQLGKKFKYIKVDPDAKTYPIKQALHLLNKAGITYQCFHTAAQSYPLGAEVDEKKFKVFFFDIGIAHRILGLDLSEWVTHPMEVELFGFSAEQLVAQELISYSEPSQKGELYYWHSESSTSNAEVDFITIHNKKIIPVEVKSKIKGGMKSLNVFLSKHHKSPYGIKISEGMFGKHDHLCEIPLYGVKNIYI
ncbi:MAG: ATP-binding protein [Parachlamydiaceae bacterium]|nr:ATP-binding protein [Parachlamydiaceae bacterium]